MGLVVNNDRMHHLDTNSIPFLIHMSPFCFFILKMGSVYKTTPPGKLLPQFDCTTCLEML